MLRERLDAERLCEGFRTVEWFPVTRDGMTGKIVIGGEKLRLEDGGVFRVDTRNGVTVEQTAVDMRLLEGDVGKRLKTMAATDGRRFLHGKACDSPE